MIRRKYKNHRIMSHRFLFLIVTGCLVSISSLYQCKNANSCTKLFDGKVQYCLNEEYSGSIEQKTFWTDVEYYKIVRNNGLEEIEVSWQQTDERVNIIGSYDVVIQDLLKKDEEVIFLNVDTSMYSSYIEATYKNKDIFYIESSKYTEEGILSIRYRCQHIQDCFTDRARIQNVINSIILCD